MKKYLQSIFILVYMLFSLTGCSPIGEKTSSLIVIYGATAFMAFLMLIGYCCLIQKKDVWFLLLFSAVFIVNTGYLALAVSQTVEEALLANRISYLGSVFLPLSMLMIITKVCKIQIPRWAISILLIVSVIMFFIAASPGYLDIYYKSVSLTRTNGVTVLQKVYGPWHSFYLYYLITYFSSMIASTFYAIIRKKAFNSMQAVFLASATFVNIGVWLCEQLVYIDFEFLSISYIISELFLLLVIFMLQENRVLTPTVPTISDSGKESSLPATPDKDMTAKGNYLISQLPTLTPTEQIIYNYYLDGKTTKEILEDD